MIDAIRTFLDWAPWYMFVGTFSFALGMVVGALSNLAVTLGVVRPLLRWWLRRPNPRNVMLALGGDDL